MPTTNKEEEIVLNACYKFASKIRNEIAKNNLNQTLSFSTPSILIALSMALKGFNSTDKKNFLETTGLNALSEDRIHAVVGNLVNRLQMDSANAKCSVSNALLTCQKNTFSKKFIKNMENRYGAQLICETTGQKLEEAANNFVSKNTKNMILQIVDPSTLSKDSSIIVNAIYFKGLWQDKFQKEASKIETFTDITNNKSNVMMLKSERDTKYYEKNGMKMVEIPYKSSNGKKLSFVAMLPTGRESIENFEKRLDLSAIKDFRKQARTETVDLTLPKFEIESSYTKLKEYLESMGCSFKGGVDGELNQVTDIIHKTKVKLDESGTEAAAVTAITMEATYCPPSQQPKIKTFNANRPFSYMIMVDDNVLFQGSIRSSEGLAKS